MGFISRLMFRLLCVHQFKQKIHFLPDGTAVEISACLICTKSKVRVVFNKDIVKELCRHCEGTTKRIVECHLPHRADLVLKCEKCQGRGFNLVARQNGNH